MKTFLILLAMTFLASCTVLDKAGIVKRKYRPGFYISPIFAQRQHHHQLPDSTRDKKINTIQTEAISGHSEQTTGNNDLAIQEISIQSSSNNSKKMNAATLINKVKENSKNTPLLNEFPIKENNNYSARNSLLEMKTRRSVNWGGDGCGYGCANFIFAMIVALAAMGIWAIFPAMAPESATLLAFAIVLLLMIILLLIRKDMMENRRQDMHHFHH